MALSKERLEQLLNRARRDPLSTRGLSQQELRELVEYEKQQTKPTKPTTPGGRGRMTRQEKSQYIDQHGATAYLNLPW